MSIKNVVKNELKALQIFSGVFFLFINFTKIKIIVL